MTVYIRCSITAHHGISWEGQFLIHVIYRRAVLNTHHLRPKFVVSCCLQFSKGFWVFLFCPWNHLSGGGANANHNAMHLPCFTRKDKTANDSKLNNSKGNRNGEWNFCQGEEADIVLFLQVTRIRTTRKVFGAKKSIIARNRTITIKQLTLKHRNKQDGSKSTSHKS